MQLLREEVYRLIAEAKGDVPLARDRQRKARYEYRALVDRLTRDLQRAAPGELSVTHESVEAALEEAYEDHRRRIGRRSSL